MFQNSIHAVQFFFCNSRIEIKRSKKKKTARCSRLEDVSDRQFKDVHND